MTTHRAHLARVLRALRQLSCGVVLASMVLGCGADDEGAPLRFVTLDASLGGRTAEAPARLDLIVDALNAETADVICLQGLWTGQDGAIWNEDQIEELLRRTAATYPHSYWERTIVPADAPAGAEFWYDGHNGLALLSRHRFTQTEHLAFEYAVVARSVLRAAVETPDRGTVDVYCTELTPNNLQPFYPLEGPFESFEQENLAQMDALLTWVDETATSTRVLLGNFGHGPDGGAVRAEFTESYERVLAAGYADPIGDPPAGCTWCDDNPLVPGGGDILIDHVYVESGAARGATAEIVLDDLIDVTGTGGEPLTIALSDHYGVAVTF